MAQTIQETLYNGSGCEYAITVDDATELLDLGLGQYMMDHEPGNLYNIPAKCGTACKDDSGNTWQNCKGWLTPTEATIKTTKTKAGRYIIPILVIAAIILVFIYFKKKK